MKISGLDQNIMQEKWNFSLVLMETIVDTLLKVTSSKFRLIQLKAFSEWKQCKIDSRLKYWIKLKEKIIKLASLHEYLRKKRLLKFFSKLNEVTMITKLKNSFDKEIDQVKNKYKSKLMMMSQEINDLNEKQLTLEKNSTEYIQKEKNYKASIRALEENSEPKESISSEEIIYLQNENIRLKSKLQNKESKLISYFEGLSAMIDNAPITQITK
jgi:hypothetical protein